MQYALYGKNKESMKLRKLKGLPHFLFWRCKSVYGLRKTYSNIGKQYSIDIQTTRKKNWKRRDISIKNEKRRLQV